MTARDLVRAGTVAAIVAALTACSSLDPDVGALQATACSDSPIAPDVTVHFTADIVPILKEYCYRCHTPSPYAIGIEIGGLDMSSYTGLRAGGNVAHAHIIVPGSPCQSIIWQKVNPGPPFGNRMPLDGPPYLEDADLDALHDWIAEGAHDD
jgi:hypothetical protein